MLMEAIGDIETENIDLSAIKIQILKKMSILTTHQYLEIFPPVRKFINTLLVALRMNIELSH